MSWQLSLVVRLILLVARALAGTVGENELADALKHISNEIAVNRTKERQLEAVPDAS